MPQMRRAFPGAVALLAAWAFSLASYAHLPARLTVRWNVEFEPAGSASRLVAAVVVPSLLLAMPLLASVLARIDPRRDSYERHRSTYWLLWNLVMALIAALQAVTVGIGLGWEVDTARLFPLLVGGLLIVTGNFLTRLRPNWFLGIRTPWTLSDDEVWRRTHRLGARAMMLGGALLAVGGLLASEWLRSAAWMAAFVLVVVAPIAYSYLVWRRLVRARRYS
jgi:uncharacterized membrane protein